MDTFDTIDHVSSLRDYWLFFSGLGFIALFIEAFVPPIPLAGFVAWHGFVLGPTLGLVVSLAGSVAGSYALYIVARYFGPRIPARYQNEGVRAWLVGQPVWRIALVYALPFVPHILLTVAMGLAGTPVVRVLLSLMIGKTILFSVLTSLGTKALAILQNPFIAVFVFMIFVGITIWSQRAFNKHN
ncbi:MAG: TVP38/TMEM64 family protein [Bacilli bacterium]